MVLNANKNVLINKSISDFVIITHIYREFVTMYKEVIKYFICTAW